MSAADAWGRILKLTDFSQVVKKTEVITKKIQELLISAQEGRQEAFMPCAEQIHAAVLDMDSIFPKASLSLLVLCRVFDCQSGLCLTWPSCLPSCVMSWQIIPICGWAH